MPHFISWDYKGFDPLHWGCIFFFCRMKLACYEKLTTQQAIDNSDSEKSEGDELLYDVACLIQPMISPWAA